jgi:rod shape determining protein RodA
MRSISGPISTITNLPESVRGDQLRRLGGARWGLVVAALLLSAIGLATVHSASSELAVDYLPRQALFVGAGLLLFLIALSIDYRVLLGLSIPAYLLSTVLLIAVLVVGHEAGGARSWLGVGGWRLQPSEFAKIATALLLARYLSTISEPYLRARQIATALAMVALPMELIRRESDLGGAAMFVPMLAAVLLVAGIRPRVLVAAIVAVVIGGGLAWSFGMRPYQRERVLTFLQPERDPLGAGYQVRQSKIAVGSGELTGKGYMQGTQSQLRFLPARHTDFIFAVLAEEWGFAGVATTLFLYGSYLLSGARVAMRARDRAGILLVVALLASTASLVLYNTAMVVGLAPNTGIPLPFLSYGGSFMLANYIALGIILGVDVRRYVNR